MRTVLSTSRNTYQQRANYKSRFQVRVMSSTNVPTIYYFPGFRGRSELVKLALTVAGKDYNLVEVSKDVVKPDRETFPFAQVPVYKDEDILLGQSNAILRYLGNKYDLMGANPVEQAKIDMFVEGVEAIRLKYLGLIYLDRLADEAKAQYVETYLNPETSTGRNGGAHFQYLQLLLKKEAGEFVVGNKVSVADLTLFDLVDVHRRILENEMQQMYPDLIAHHEMISKIPAIEAYLKSPKRLEQANNYNLG
eukprot:TRINITY_DN4504_c0_g1_i1.p1 TRINITY_DN4504_c0_g1~~TRINITY_DN4504_c0_g1_i1.p1  ORF type:complete len:250 (-),score=26.68 TRINITY_DN4504_c0_g1_i1:256-1005(-)